jgi:hypothetical protein
MQMIGHQHIGVNGDHFLRSDGPEPLQEQPPIRIREEHRRPVDAAQDRMHGDGCEARVTGS